VTQTQKPAAPTQTNNTAAVSQTRSELLDKPLVIKPVTDNDSAEMVQDMTHVELALNSNIPPLAIKIKTGDSLANLFRRNNLSAQTLHKIVKLGKPTRALRNIQPGQMIRIQVDAKNELQQLVYEMDRFSSLSIQRQGDSFTAKKLVRQTQKRTHFAHGVIERSLFEDGKEAGLSTGLIMELAGIFGWDIDFALDLRKGDRFSLIYEEHFLDGKKVQDGPIIAAQFTNQNRQLKAIRFVDNNGFANYYTPEGLSMRKAFLRTPVDFRRISSRFGNRRHPTLNRLRMHKGVDYAARRGTPIKASGDGKIVHKKRKGGYGRAIIIKHGGRYSTLYAHLQSYKRGIYVGKKVKQGQIIGYVGSSGRATGPHLHYEFRVNGVHRNPLTIKLPNAAPIKKQYRKDFMHFATQMIARLDSYLPTQVATNLNADQAAAAQ